MFKSEYQFESLTLDQQKSIIQDGKFIDSINDSGFNIHLYFCENSYYVTAFVPDGTIEIDFMCLASSIRK